MRRHDGEDDGGSRTFGLVGRRARHLLAAILLLCGGAGAALPAAPHATRWRGFADVVFRHLGADEAMPGAGATALAQDRAGFLWVGSQSGVARWDGYRFRSYAGAEGLPDTVIKTLHVDLAGRLWVGTNAGGLARYDRARDRFVAYPVGQAGTSHASVTTIADDGTGGLWVGTGGGLDHLDRDLARFTRVDALKADGRVWALARDAHGTVWVGTTAGLVRLDRGGRDLVRVPLPDHDGRQPAVLALMADAAGRLWIGTRGAGAFLIEPGAAHMPVPAAALPGPAHDTVKAIVAAGPDEVWLATDGGGIVIVDAATRRARRIRHEPSVATSLADDTPVAMLRDASGLLWVGTQRGLSRHDPMQTTLRTLFGATRPDAAVSGQDAQSVFAAPDGRVWVGLGSGIDIVDPLTGRVGHIAPDPARPASALPATPVLALAGAGGAIYIGTTEGLYRAAADGRGVARVAVGAASPYATVPTLTADAGQLWLGRLDGLWRLPLDGRGAAERIAASDRFSDQRVTAIRRAPDGTLWIGTQNGLNRYDPVTHAAQRIVPTAGLVSTLLVDRAGRLWAGAYGRGLYMLSGAPGARRLHARRVGVAQGLPNPNVDKLLEDAFGRIWASTDGGLAMIDPVTFAVRPIGEGDGLAISSYWNESGTRTAAGDLLFGGLGGVTVVQPERIVSRAPPAPLAITDIRVGGQRVRAGSFDGAEPVMPLIVPGRANEVAIEFAALDYADPDRNRYAYRLAGYDEEWRQADPEHRIAGYTNLPPGDYVLEIRGANRDGVWTARSLRVPVRVLPRWYQTLWFAIALVAAAAGAMWLVVQLRTALFKARQRELEAQVAERTAELRRSQLELQQIAYIDVLTGLPNRRMFNDTLNTLLARAERRAASFALLLIDLDRFKQINDTLGHDAGDALLVEVAARLQTVVSEFDTVARLGGDEFAILVADAARPEAVDQLCRRVLGSFAEPIPFADSAMQPMGSIGIAVYPHDGTTPGQLYKASDTALYRAKSAGRNRWAWFQRDAVDKRG